MSFYVYWFVSMGVVLGGMALVSQRIRIRSLWEFSERELRDEIERRSKHGGK